MECTLEEEERGEEHYWKQRIQQKDSVSVQRNRENPLPSSPSHSASPTDWCRSKNSRCNASHCGIQAASAKATVPRQQQKQCPQLSPVNQDNSFAQFIAPLSSSPSHHRIGSSSVISELSQHSSLSSAPRERMPPLPECQPGIDNNRRNSKERIGLPAERKERRKTISRSALDRPEK